MLFQTHLLFPLFANPRIPTPAPMREKPLTSRPPWAFSHHETTSVPPFSSPPANPRVNRLDGKTEKWEIVPMKTTIDLPDPIFRRAKATAAVEGVTLKSFITRAVENSLARPKMTVSELLHSLPRVPKETIVEINRRVAEMDADDLKFQAEAATGKAD